MLRTDKDYKRLSINEFSRAAKIYETDHAGVYRMCRKDYPDVLEELEKEDFSDLLDCGCGTAPIISMLKEKYPDKHYTGIDITPEMIEIAKQKNMAGVDLVVGDCENMPFKGESFDAVICTQSFHHYPDAREFFKNVCRVLRPGGRLILRDMTSNCTPIRWFINNIELPVLNILGYGDVRVYGRKDIEELCHNTGLRVELYEKRGFFRMHCVVRKPF